MVALPCAPALNKATTKSPSKIGDLFKKPFTRFYLQENDTSRVQRRLTGAWEKKEAFLSLIKHPTPKTHKSYMGKKKLWEFTPNIKHSTQSKCCLISKSYPVDLCTYELSNLCQSLHRHLYAYTANLRFCSSNTDLQKSLLSTWACVAVFKDTL